MALKDTSPGALTLHLYSSNTTPTATSTTANFTEATFTNYAAKTLARSDWAYVDTASNVVTWGNVAQSWTCGATGQTVYGYFVTSGTDVVWAQKFSVPRQLAEGDTLSITPRFSLS